MHIDGRAFVDFYSDSIGDAVQQLIEESALTYMRYEFDDSTVLKIKLDESGKYR